MVEGPGATRNGRKLQPALGCVVHSVEQPSSSSQQHQQLCLAALLEGETLVEAFCVGKEVFLVFSNDTAVRLHFGMNGSLSLVQGERVGQLPAKSNTSTYHNKKRSTYQPLSLRLKLDPSMGNHNSSSSAATTATSVMYVMECFGAMVSSVTANVARSKRERLQALDVCQSNAVFDASAVLAALQKRPESMICDALLDQNKFPGVGNIIKIEGLHKAKIHPKRQVASLSETELQSVIHHCRQYALKWLQQGRAASKKVYNQTNCQTCGSIGSVRMVKLGIESLSRVTFWCDICQPLMIGKSTVNSSNILVGATKKRPLTSIHQSTILVVDNNNTTANNKVVKRNNDGKQTSSTRTTKNACPQHGPTTFLIRRVRHKEANRNRLFGTCRVKGCPYFVWADNHFPNCTTCRGKTILRVSKTEHSGGRWFFSCSTKTCKGMFAWATPEQLEPLGTCLTPLL